MRGEWFVKRGPGILFIPTVWQGWVSIIAMLILILTSAYLNNHFSAIITIQDRARLAFEIVIIIIISILFFDSHAKQHLD